jgi:hypothetical protein
MRELERWLNDAGTPQSLRDVLGAAPSIPPMPAQLDAKLSAYALGLVAQGLPAKAAVGHGLLKAALARVVGSSTIKALAVVSLMGAAGTASYVAVGHRLEVPPSARPANTNSPLTAVKRRTPALASVLAPATEPATASPVATDTRSLAVSRRASPSGAAASEQSSAERDSPRALARPSIADEAQLLESARTALIHEPALALDIVQRHQARYPDGQLSAEREFIAVEALLRLGRRDDAKRRAAPRLQQDPDSLYAKRLRHLLGHE